MTPGRSRMALLLTIAALAAFGLTRTGTSGPALARELASGLANANKESQGPQPIPPLPTPAPDAAEAALQPDQWQESEILDAKRACAAIAAETSARFEVLTPRREGQCGAPAPIRLESIGRDAPVRFVPAPVITCDLVAGLARWIDQGLKPLAERHLDSAVSEVRVISSYACRTRYGRAGARMSEHAFANALDIAGFRLADGRDIVVLDDWGATRRDLLDAARSTSATGSPILPPAAAAGQISTAGPISTAGTVTAAGPAAGAARARVDTETADTMPPIPQRRPLKAAAGRSAALRAQPDKTPSAARLRASSGVKARQSAKRPRNRPAPISPAPATPPDSGRDAARFLRDSHRIACGIFGTTLGPEANDAHRNHFHVDMFPRRNRGYCE